MLNRDESGPNELEEAVTHFDTPLYKVYLFTFLPERLAYTRK